MWIEYEVECKTVGEAQVHELDVFEGGKNSLAFDTGRSHVGNGTPRLCFPLYAM